MQLAKQAVIIAAQALVAPLNMFYELLSSSNTIGIYWSFFLFAVVYRLLIAPLIGRSIHGGSSDKVQRKRNSSAKED